MSEYCVICQETLCSPFSTIGTIVPCGHVVHRSCFQDFITAHNISNTHITRVRAALTSVNLSTFSRLPHCPICKHESKEFMPLFLSFDPYESPTNATVVELGRFLGQKIDQSNETIELLRSERQQLISNSKDQSDKLLDQSNETIKLLRSERQQLISNSKDQSKMLLDLGARLKRELSYTVNIVKFMNLLAIWFGFFLGLGLVFVYCVYYRLFPFSWCMQ